MNKYCLNKTQRIQQRIYAKNVKNLILASLYTKNGKIPIDKVNYIRDQPITLISREENILAKEKVASLQKADLAPEAQEGPVQPRAD